MFSLRGELRFRPIKSWAVEVRLRLGIWIYCVGSSSSASLCLSHSLSCSEEVCGNQEFWHKKKKYWVRVSSSLGVKYTVIFYLSHSLRGGLRLHIYSCYSCIYILQTRCWSLALLLYTIYIW